MEVSFAAPLWFFHVMETDMNSHRKRTRRLRLESLERRAMLSGTVAVKVAGHTLILTGDNNDNTAVVSGTNGT